MIPLQVMYPPGSVNRNAKTFNKKNVQQAPSVSFQGVSEKLYTLIMSDPQANPAATKNTRPLQEGFASYLHWLIVNIPYTSAISEGVVKKEYQPPTPPSGTHYYYFQVFEQQNPQQLMNEYLQDFQSEGSPLFKVQQFVAKNNLKLVGEVRMSVSASGNINKRN